MPTIRFVERVELNVATGEVRRAGRAVRLEPQPAAVLVALVERAGELVTHDELHRVVWGDATHVKVHDALHYCIRQIRRAIGDAARAPRYIETIPRRGYRLRAASLLADAGRAESGFIAAVPPSSGARRWGRRLALAGALLLTAAALEQRPNNHHQIAVSLLESVHDLFF